MSESKIEITIGEITFSGQGEPEWVAKQLDKILAQAEKLIQLTPQRGNDNDRGEEGDHKPMGKRTRPSPRKHFQPSCKKRTLAATR